MLSSLSAVRPPKRPSGNEVRPMQLLILIDVREVRPLKRPSGNEVRRLQ